MAGDRVLNQDMVDQHSLPWDLEPILGDSVLVVDEDLDVDEAIQRLDQNMDGAVEAISCLSRAVKENDTYKEGSDELYMGDGMNLYRVRTTRVLDTPPGRKILTGECLGVVGPDTYDDMMANGGFPEVLEFMAAHTPGNRNANELDKAFYDEGDFIASPDYEPAEGEPEPVTTEEFYGNTQAKRARRAVKDDTNHLAEGDDP